MQILALFCRDDPVCMILIVVNENGVENGVENVPGISGRLLVCYLFIFSDWYSVQPLTVHLLPLPLVDLGL